MWQTAVYPEHMTSLPRVREPEARAPVTNVRGRERAGPHDCVGETSPGEAETEVRSLVVRTEDIREGWCLEMPKGVSQTRCNRSGVRQACADDYSLR